VQTGFEYYFRNRIFDYSPNSNPIQTQCKLHMISGNHCILKMRFVVTLTINLQTEICTEKLLSLKRKQSSLKNDHYVTTVPLRMQCLFSTMYKTIQKLFFFGLPLNETSNHDIVHKQFPACWMCLLKDGPFPIGLKQYGQLPILILLTAHMGSSSIV